MSDLFEEYRRSKGGSKNDPRLSSSVSSEGHSNYSKRRVSTPPKTSSKSPAPEIRNSDPNWQRSTPQSQVNQYNSSGVMQTAYQHLQPTMYSDPNQYSSQGYSTTYTSYPAGYVSQPNTYNPYQEYNQDGAGYTTGSIQPGPPGEEYPHNEWAPASGYQGVSQQVHHPQQMIGEPEKSEGVAQELKQQKAQMSKQREEYVRKVVVLRRELELLRNQKQELLTQHSSEHDNNHILRENSKLQCCHGVPEYLWLLVYPRYFTF